MEELIFQKVQKGDMIFTLEKDRRSGYPIFDQARVLKVGESKPYMPRRLMNCAIRKNRLKSNEEINNNIVMCPDRLVCSFTNPIY